MGVFKPRRSEGKSCADSHLAQMKTSRTTSFYVRFPFHLHGSVFTTKHTEPGLTREWRALASWKQAQASTDAFLPAKDLAVCFDFELPYEGET